MATALKDLGDAIVTLLRAVTWTDKTVDDSRITFAWDPEFDRESFGSEPRVSVTIESRTRTRSARVLIEERPVVVIDVLWTPEDITATTEDQTIQIAEDILNAVDVRQQKPAGFSLVEMENEPLLAKEQIRQTQLLRSTVSLTFVRDIQRS